MLYFATAALVALIIVNGMTDAPNAITCAVVTEALPLKKAATLAGLFNLIGCLLSVTVWGGVAYFTFSLTSFADYTDSSAALVALTMGILSVVIWSFLAWYLGIPTSESHGMLASVGGACCAFAIRHGIHLSDALNLKGWIGVAIGFLVSTIPPYVFSRFFSLVNSSRHRYGDRGKPSNSNRRDALCRYGQITCAMLNAFLHGAQDGQKFIGIAMTVIALSGLDGDFTITAVAVPVAVLISIGTLLGGKRIIEHTGKDLVTLNTAQGFCADLTSSFFLGVCLVAGLPVSTTHAKTCAIMGAGKNLNRSVCRQLVIAWIATLPICFCLGFALSYIALS